MKSVWSSAAVLAAVLASSVRAHPLNKRAVAAITDPTVLQFALTLEHLENAFYTQGLAKFSEADFLAAGLPVWARGRFVEIGENEATHVKFLTDALGANATQACTYSFPLTDPVVFAQTSGVFEGVGTSAYTGAANLLSDKTLVTQAAAILATEARQASWVESAVLKHNPWSTSFETPLDLSQAFSLAAGFIVSCPSTNPVLPVQAFPTLTITPGNPLTPGQTVAVAFNTSAAATAKGPIFLALLTGLQKVFLPISVGSGGALSATFPSDVAGTVYAVVTSNNNTATDADTLAGAQVLQFPFLSSADQQNPGLSL